MRIAIFGTTGAGKTTLISEMVEQLAPEKYEVYHENFDECPYFSDSLTIPADQQQDHTYKVDIWMLSDRMKILKKSHGKKNVIFDRGILDSGVFGEACHKAGYTKKMDHDTYMEYFKICVAPMVLENKENYEVIVYLKVSPETAIKRLNERGRRDEMEADKGYWKSLCETYDKWYNILKDKAKFIVIEGDNKTPKQLAKEAVEKIKNIENK